VGERILKATQGRQSALPVCDFSTAVACVIYPVESERETRLEAAGFSVVTLAASNESDCFAYKDEKARSRTLDLSFDLHLYPLSHVPARVRHEEDSRTCSVIRVLSNIRQPEML
jgi:hypothetical protein